MWENKMLVEFLIFEVDENKLTLVFIIMRDADDDFVSLDYEDDN